jgi:hypothetical protein
MIEVVTAAGASTFLPHETTSFINTFLMICIQKFPTLSKSPPLCVQFIARCHFQTAKLNRSVAVSDWLLCKAKPIKINNKNEENTA